MPLAQASGCDASLHFAIRQSIERAASTLANAMTYNTPQSLLSLSPNVANPDAYRVLGLPLFETDRVKIKAAADSKLSRLNESRASADPAAWTAAVQMVKSAQAILGDVGKKAAYDRKLAAENPPQSPAADPLAGVLPVSSANSASAAQPAIDPLQSFLPKPAAVPPPLATSPSAFASPTAVATAPAFDASPAYDSPGAAAPVRVPVVRRASTASRKRFPWVPVILSVFCLIALGGLFGVIYMFQQGGGGIVLDPDGNMTLASADGRGGARVSHREVALAAEQRQRQSHGDPVMGDMAGNVSPPKPWQGTNDATALDPAQTAVTSPMAGDDSMSNSMDDMESDSTMTPEPMTPEPTVPEPTTPEPTVPATVTPEPTTPEPPMVAEPTAEQLQMGAAAIDKVTNAIRRADWSNMKSLAQAAETAAAGEAQLELASSLYQLVDLATYYHGALTQSIGTLGSGIELDLTDDLKIVIVEVAPERLVIRFNGKNKEYPMQMLPLSLAHKLASMSVAGEEATIEAAKYAYQAVAPVTTPPFREEAIVSLGKITGEVEGAEPAKLIAAIRHVYAQ